MYLTYADNDDRLEPGSRGECLAFTVFCIPNPHLIALHYSPLENKRSSFIIMMMQTTAASILLLICWSCLHPCHGIGSRHIGLPGHYDRAYTSVDASGAPLPQSSRDAWRSHNFFSVPPIFQKDLKSRRHPILPSVRFADASAVVSSNDEVRNEVINPEDWMISRRVPFIRSAGGEGAAAGTAPAWDPDVSPFVVGPAVGQEKFEPPAHQQDDGHRHERIPFLSHFFND